MIRPLIAFFIFSMTAPPVHAAQMDKNEIISKVEARFESIKNFKAKFTQKLFNAAMGESEKSAGTVAMQKPLKMAWEYTEPVEQQIVSDGKNLFFYIPADKQVIREPIGKILTSRSPALFLAGNRKLSDIFTIELEPAANKDRIKDEIELTLYPIEKSLTLTRLILRVGGKDYTVRSFTLYDWAGNRTDIEFTEMEVNGKIDGKRFVFEKPEGVEQIEMPRFNFGAN